MPRAYYRRFIPADYFRIPRAFIRSQAFKRGSGNVTPFSLNSVQHQGVVFGSHELAFIGRFWMKRASRFAAWQCVFPASSATVPAVLALIMTHAISRGPVHAPCPVPCPAPCPAPCPGRPSARCPASPDRPPCPVRAGHGRQGQNTAQQGRKNEGLEGLGRFHESFLFWLNTGRRSVLHPRAPLKTQNVSKVFRDPPVLHRCIACRCFATVGYKKASAIEKTDVKSSLCHLR